MSPLDTARATLATAIDAHLSAEKAELEAHELVATAGRAFGDAPSKSAEGTWREAKDAHELAKLVLAGAVRRLEAARADLAKIEREETEARHAAAVAGAERGAFFLTLAPAIARLAALQVYKLVEGAQVGSTLTSFQPPPTLQLVDELPDVYGFTDKATHKAALDAFARRQVVLGVELRAVRAAIKAQHQAVTEQNGLAGSLGLPFRRDLAPVRESDVHALVALSQFPNVPPGFAEAWARAFDINMSGYLHLARHELGASGDGMARWLAVFLTSNGDAVAALDAGRSPTQRADAEARRLRGINDEKERIGSVQAHLTKPNPFAPFTGN